MAVETQPMILLQEIANAIVSSLSAKQSTVAVFPSIDEKRVSVSFHELVHKGSRIEGILKDLLDLPIKNIANILHHPVMMLYIERRWLKTKWMFMVSFLLYLTFLLMFSVFLGLMYFR